jgi:hypothetical protein
MRDVRASLLIACLVCGCGNRGAVSFELKAPQRAELDPLRDARATEFLIKAADGTLIAAASQRDEGGPLPLGRLQVTTQPGDLEIAILGGTELLGMARVRDVSIKPGVEVRYPAEVRKPFFFVGAALPQEPLGGNVLKPPVVLDPGTSRDLAQTLGMSGKLPMGTSAATVTSDGRFLLAGHAGTPGLTVIDTGSAAVVGELPLSFVPSRIAVSSRDSAVALLDVGEPDGGLAIIRAVPTLTSSPADAEVTRVTLRAQTPRKVAFAPDGQTLYVLSAAGRFPDPCATTPLPANSVTAFDLDGNAKGTWSLSAFAADMAVEARTGVMVVTLAAANSVGLIPPNTPPGPVTPQKLADGIVCPTAVAVANGEAFVVTGQPDKAATTQFRMQRLSLKGGPPSTLPFPAPNYEGIVNESQSPDMKVNVKLDLHPAMQHAYEMTVAPDGSRALFATRTRYVEKNQVFDLIMSLVCTANLDITEYGLYTLDTRTGAATYEMRSQIVTSPAANTACVRCINVFFDIPFVCQSTPGDRPAGLTTVFGGP